MNAAWLWLLACAAEPVTKATCDAMRAGEARDECYLEVLEVVFREDEAAGIQMIEEGITDPVNRDSAWYRAAKVRWKQAYCRHIQDVTLRKACVSWTSAPWLWRTELVQGSR